MALAGAAYCAWHGYRLVYDNKFAIDRALRWYALAIVLLAYFAWDGAVPAVARWPSRVVAYVREHPLELAVLAAVIGVGVFVRLWRFGTMPPDGFLYGEEHINGGVAWEVLQGDRPYIYPLVRYATALGLWMFGPSTTGLRAVMVAAGIAAIPVFYLLMREAVDRPAALFATALFASLRVVADGGAHHHTPMLASLLMAWTMLRALRTGNLIWFIPAALLAGIISYEYETAKAVPLFAIPFLFFFALRAIAWPPPRTLRALGNRVVAWGPRAAKAVVVIAVAALLALGPLYAQRHRGEDIYFGSLNRQKEDRQARGTPGLFAPDAERQFKWALQVFTPRVKPGYPAIGPIASREVIDNMTSLLLWGAVVAAALQFWRGARLFFLIWFAGGVLISALLLANFQAWKMVGFLPPAVALIGFLADDALQLLRRTGDRWLVLAGLSLLSVMAGVVLVANVRTLNAVSRDRLVLQEFGNQSSQLYAVCDELRHRPDDNYAFVEQRAKSGWGFSSPAVDDNERRTAWGDFKFVCWGLEGRAIADLQELWPPAFDQDRPVTVLTTASIAQVAQEAATLRRALPELGEPDTIIDSPGPVFRIATWETTRDELNARRGLVWRALSPGAGVLGEGIATAPVVETMETIPGAGAVDLSGLVYVPANDGTPLLLTTEDAAPISIAVDGQPSAASLLQGWHVVTARAETRLTSPFTFVWQNVNGQRMPTAPEDFFALPDLSVWTHTRTLAAEDGSGRVTTARVDFEPHVAALDGMTIDGRAPLPPRWRATEDRWGAVWDVGRAGAYTLRMSAPESKASLIVDGRPVVEGQPGQPQVDGRLLLAPGPHTVELVFSGSGERYTGGSLVALDEAMQPVEIAVRPF